MVSTGAFESKYKPHSLLTDFEPTGWDGESLVSCTYYSHSFLSFNEPYYTFVPRALIAPCI